jgi:hypothetical protein
MKLIFRDLKPNEIDVKPQTIKENGISLLLYKNARVDMDILDESVGCTGWQRKHSRDNANCIVSIYDEDKKIWIDKEDTGTESFAEKEKGLASDSFKRACVNWGIGRELYTSPFIWISDKNYIYDTGKKDKYNNPIYSTREKFKVLDIEITDKTITKLTIGDSKNNVVYTFNKNNKEQFPKFKFERDDVIEKIKNKIGDNIEKLEKVLNSYKVKGLQDLTDEQLEDCRTKLKIK